MNLTGWARVLRVGTAPPAAWKSSGLAISTQCTLLGSLLPLGQLSTSVAADQVSQLHVLHFKMMSLSLTPASMLMPRT